MPDDYENRHVLVAQLQAAQAAHSAAVEARLRSIPPYLQRFPHWGVFTSEKVAVALDGINRGWPHAKTDGCYHLLGDASTWAAFAPVVASLRPGGAASRLSIIAGPTMALTADMGAIMIDLDPPERNLPVGSDRDPQLLGDRMDFAREVTRWILQWAAHCGAYVEASSSGQGRHIIVRGTFSAYKYAIGWFGHILRQNHHIHLTGKRLAGHDAPLAQVAVDELIAFLLSRDIIREVVPGDRAATNLADIETYGRRLDLSDAEVLAKLRSTNRTSFDALHSSNFGGDWSQITLNIIGDLDKVSGSGSQVRRILFSSERMRDPGRAGNKGQTDRFERTDRKFDAFLLTARSRNDPLLAERAARSAEINAQIERIMPSRGATP